MIRNAKRQASSLRDAMDLCLAHALEKHHRSVDRVADLMGLSSKWTLYKWMESARLPANLIPVFEHACGAHFVTAYLGQAAHKLVVDMPAGKAVKAQEINTLQGSFTHAVGLLIQFYQGQAQADETVQALTEVMGALAWQRENVAKTQAPELDLFEGEGE